ncbi:hypothetical protein E4T38_05202 [Aureobasidium subglaciale]|nr:hypothetical protein E4T38_05202 [Aureobasidium subglaciale]KAI5220322.1 hypothetical protein E4T40_05966 [Aureobasidium subglaciale]KAI5222913.1 hypothetical protein E4T41_06392 [Aureobasidium subglaciale]KAI5260130.1 hypothetical protein E4T46_06274 [Aureobasidium subglaciale]
MPTTSILSTRLEKEINRNAQLRQELEVLRRRCNQDDEILTTLTQRLEEGTELQASLHMQTSGLQTKVDRLADKLARRDKIQKAEYERRIVTVANERDMLASRLRMAEAGIERAQVAEAHTRSVNEKLRVAEKNAQIATSQVMVLQKQLLELKTNIAARPGTQTDVSDQEILDMMNKFNHLVQNWFEKITALQDAKSLRKLYTTFDTSIKIFAFQATVMYLLMPIFDARFFGLPEELQGLESAAQAMICMFLIDLIYARPADNYIATCPTFNDWRKTTHNYLKQGNDDLEKRYQDSQAKAQAHLVEHVCKIMSALTGLTVVEEQGRTLSSVVKHAVSLSQVLGCQRATYRCFLPEADAEDDIEFDYTTMEDLMNEQEEDGLAKDIRCVVFPALQKTGGETGDNVRHPYSVKPARLTNPGQMNVMNVLMKAKVLCVEADSDQDDQKG